MSNGDAAEAFANLGVPAPVQPPAEVETGEGTARGPIAPPAPAPRPLHRDQTKREENLRREPTAAHPQHEPSESTERR